MRYPQAVIAALSLGLAGCGTPEHSNMLVFGTNTSFGVDISANPTTSSPSFKIGYARQELALIPLLANKTGEKRTPADCAAGSPPGSCSFVGKGLEGADAYSVLGTFGGSAGGGNDGASMKIAQYFATGLAARALAEQGGAQLVNTEAAPPAASGALVAAIQIFQTNNLALIDKALPEAQFAAELPKLVAKAYPDGGGTAAALTKIPGKAELMAYLSDQPAIAARLAAATK